MSEELTPYSVSYDLSNCDAEPIQHINLYQGHGLLIVIDLSTELVCAVSQTAVTEFGLPAHQLLNQPISFFLPAEIYSLLPLPSTEQKYLKLQNPIHVPRWARGTNKRYQNMVCHRTEHHLLLELWSVVLMSLLWGPEAGSCTLIGRLQVSLIILFGLNFADF